MNWSPQGPYSRTGGGEKNCPKPVFSPRRGKKFQIGILENLPRFLLVFLPVFCPELRAAIYIAPDRGQKKIAQLKVYFLSFIEEEKQYLKMLMT